MHTKVEISLSKIAGRKLKEKSLFHSLTFFVWQWFSLTVITDQENALGSLPQCDVFWLCHISLADTP